MSEKKALDQITVASPCPASWDEMTGDERVRFCNSCKLHVYNLSAMKSKEAEKLILEKEGKLCVRYYQRKDGKIMTQDCPVGIQMLLAAARKTRKVVSIIAGIIIALFTFGYFRHRPTSAPCYTTGKVAPRIPPIDDAVMGDAIRPTNIPEQNSTPILPKIRK